MSDEQVVVVDGFGRNDMNDLQCAIESIAHSISDSDEGDETIAAALAGIASGIGRLSHAVTPSNAMPGHDETGGTVASLTEAVMGATAGLCRIATAIESLAEAVRDNE